MRNPRRHRTQESVALLALQIVATALHVVPQLVYAIPSVRTTTRIVAYLAELSPAWVLLFGLTSLWLAAGLWWRRGEQYAHIGCGAVWVMYSTGLWIGALADNPHGTVFFPVVATVVVAVHLILALSYSDTAGREAPR